MRCSRSVEARFLAGPGRWEGRGELNFQRRVCD